MVIDVKSSFPAGFHGIFTKSLLEGSAGSMEKSSIISKFKQHHERKADHAQKSGKRNGPDLLQQDQDELRKWLRGAEPGHTKDFTVGKDRRNALEKLCEILGGLEAAEYGKGKDRVLVVMKTEGLTHIPIDVNVDTKCASATSSKRTKFGNATLAGLKDHKMAKSENNQGVTNRSEDQHVYHQISDSADETIEIVDDSEPERKSTSENEMDEEEERALQEALRRSIADYRGSGAAGPAARSLAVADGSAPRAAQR